MLSLSTTAPVTGPLTSRSHVQVEDLTDSEKVVSTAGTAGEVQDLTASEQVLSPVKVTSQLQDNDPKRKDHETAAGSTTTMGQTITSTSFCSGSPFGTLSLNL